MLLHNLSVLSLQFIGLGMILAFPILSLMLDRYMRDDNDVNTTHGDHNDRG